MSNLVLCNNSREFVSVYINYYASLHEIIVLRLLVGPLGDQAQLLVAKAATFGLLDVLKHLNDVERCDLKGNSVKVVVYAWHAVL